MILLLIPHESPTDLTILTRTAHGGKLVFSLNLPGEVSYLIPTNIFLAAAGMIAAALLALSKSFRHFLGIVLAQPRSAIPTIASFTILLISLLPPEQYFVAAGSSAVLILGLNMIAFAIAGTGLAPFLTVLTDRGSLVKRLSAGFDALHSWVFECSRRTFLVSSFLVFFLITNLISLLVFEHLPHVQDSIAQLFHAKIFALGHFTAPPPAEPEFFRFLQMILREQWYSQYPPGHILILAPAVLVGIPWIVNPLLGSLSVLLLYFLGTDLYGEKTGRTAALLGLASPFLLFMSSEFMNHTTALFFFLLFLLFLTRAVRSGRFLDGLISGGALGWLVLTRPYSAAALALPFLVYGLFVLIRRGPSVWHAGTGFVVSLLFFLSLLLGFNFITNGDPLEFGFQTLWGNQVTPGFGGSNAGEAHTPLKGITQTLSSLNGINKYLFEWPLPSLIFVAVLFASRGKGVWDYLLGVSFLSVLTAYFFYWFHDWCFGPRFLFETAGPLILLTARGIQQFPDWSREMLGTRAADERMRRGLAAFVLFLVAMGFASNVPAHIRNYGTSYWGVDGEALSIVRRQGVDRGIVFVPQSKFGSVFPENDPFMQKGLIFARDLGEANARLLQHYSSLPAYRLVGDSLIVFSVPRKSSLQNP